MLGPGDVSRGTRPPTLPPSGEGMGGGLDGEMAGAGTYIYVASGHYYYLGSIRYLLGTFENFKAETLLLVHVL